MGTPNNGNTTASPAATTTYTVTATDLNGCSATDNINITVNPLPVADAGPDVAICIGLSTNLLASGGVSYSWSPGAGISATNISNPVANPVVTTTYTVTVTDANGCTDTDDIIVTVNPLPPASAGNDVAICINNLTPLTASGGTAYSWSPALGLSSTTASNPNANPTTTTTYTVTVTDLNTCVNTDAVTVTVNLLPTPNAGNDQAICIGASANLSANGAFTCSWSPAASLDNPAIATPVATPVATTTYTVTATDANGCVATDDIIVTVNPLPVADAGADVPICIGLNTTLQALGGVSYSWSPAAGLSAVNVDNPTANPVATTLYTVTVTDINGCVDDDDVNVTVNPLPPANAGPDAAICINDLTTLNAAGGVNYLWSPAAGISNTQVSNPNANPTVTTTYTVMVRDANLCINTDDVIITVNPLPTPNAGVNQAICIGASANLMENSGLSYVWSPAASLNNATISNPVATPLATTTYTVTGTDANGCSAIDDVIVTVNPLPNADAGPDAPICIGLSTQIQASGGVNYSWTPATGLSVTNINNPVANPEVNTNYTVTVTDGNGCVKTDDIDIIVNPLPIADAGLDVPICIGSSTLLTATGGTQYSWNPTTNLSSAVVGNPTASPTTTTLYTVTVTDANTCVNTDDVTITVNPLPTPNAGIDQAICIGASANLSENSGLSYVWSPAASLDIPTSATPIATPVATTTYTVSATDANGCVATDDIIVTVNPLPIASAGGDVSICEGLSTNLLATGGVGYSWSPGTGLDATNIDNPVANSIITTTYTVTVTDANNCVNTADVIVTVNPLPPANAGTDVAICIGNSTQLSASGGVSYLWTPNQYLSANTLQNPTANPAATIIYTVLVTDANGCEQTDDVEVTVNPLPIVDAGQDITICYNETTPLNGSGNGNVFVWSPVTNLSDPNIPNPDADPKSTTIYTLTVTDANTCFDSDDVTITVNATPFVNFTAAEECMNVPTEFFHQCTISSGSLATFTWDFGEPPATDNVPNPIYTYLSANTFLVTLTVTSALSCTYDTTIPVTINPLPSVAFSADILTDCVPFSVDFDAMASTISTGTIDQYFWDLGNGDTPNSSQPSTAYNVAGSYTVSLTEISNKICSATLTMPDYITANPRPIADFSFTPNPADILFTPTVYFTDRTLGEPVTWAWSLGEGATSDIQNPEHQYSDTGKYPVTLLVANQFGCDDTVKKIVVVNPAFAFYIPSAFTPSDDDKNELFMARGSGIRDFEMVILDRWGSELFHSKNINEGWNGTVKDTGKPVNQGVYTYQINLHAYDKYPHYYRGTVTLIR